MWIKDTFDILVTKTMVEKQIITQSEARVLLYLEKEQGFDRYLQRISTKLNIDYAQLYRIMQGMIEKKWVKRAITPQNNKKFYNLTNAGHWKAAEAKSIYKAGVQTNGTIRIS